MHIDRFVGLASEWDSFASAQPGFTAFHRAAYLDSIAAAFGHPVERLCVRDAAGRLTGVLPLVSVQSRIFGKFLVSLPFASYGGPLGSDDAVRALASEAARRASASGAALELRSTRPLPLDLPVSHRKITVVMALQPGDPEKTFNTLKSKLRSQVRRPIKDGVLVRDGHGELDAFYRVFAEHMRDLGTPVMPKCWFAELAQRFGDDFWISVAYLGDAPIACGAGFRWGREFEITWASALRRHNKLSPNMAVYWALIERAAKEGLERFNFGRCTPDSATHKFKLQWGAVDEPLHWYQGEGAVAAPPNADSGKFALAQRVWSRLPLAVANAIGPRIVRNIP